MRLANHSPELIHPIYQREKIEDAGQWRDAVMFPACWSMSAAIKTFDRNAPVRFDKPR
jgi:hypothetical protein